MSRVEPARINRQSGFAVGVGNYIHVPGRDSASAGPDRQTETIGTARLSPGSSARPLPGYSVGYICSRRAGRKEIGGAGTAPLPDRLGSLAVTGVFPSACLLWIRLTGWISGFGFRRQVEFIPPSQSIWTTENPK